MRELVRRIYVMTGNMQETDLGHLAAQAAEELDRIDGLFTDEDVRCLRDLGHHNQDNADAGRAHAAISRVQSLVSSSGEVRGSMVGGR